MLKWIFFAIIVLFFLSKTADKDLPAEPYRAFLVQDTLRKELETLEESIEDLRQKERKQWKRLQQKDQNLYQREQQMRSYSEKLTQLYAQQDSLQASIAQLQQFLNEQSQFTKKRAIYLYKYGRQHETVLLFSSRSVNELLIRLYYLRQFKEQRDARIASYLQVQAKLSNQLRNSNILVERTKSLLKEAESYHQQLNREVGQAATSLNTLQNERLHLEEAAELKQWYIQGMNRQVQNLSNQDGNDSHHPKSLPAISLSDILSTNLRPKSDPNGVGILISAPPETVVRAALAGVVKEIFSQPGYGECAVVETEGYSVVYGNLSNIKRKVGDRLEKGDLIGTSGKEEQPMGTALFVAVYKGRQVLSPIAWLH
ncbi:MAG: peptidoglycan DD-metalloendopeptidase family protein [Rhodothermia bacterium]|nr:peptidoglycan DD-metalloendopeptidase family protein [Rhodothermia bacterium]